MRFPIDFVNRKHTASFGIVSLLLAIAPLWLMLVAVNTPVHAQAFVEVSNTSTAASPADWTEYLRDNMQRWNPYETVLGVGNVGSLQLKWEDPIGQDPMVIGSSPAVVNGVVYVGAGDGNIYALNASTGAKLWSYATGDEVGSSPAVVNGVVYLGATGADAHVYALNANNGALLWSYATDGIVWSSPAVANGVVYIGSNDANIYALNASTGEKVWSYTTGSDVFSSPAVTNGVVYIGSSDGNLYALNASTGAKLWSYATGEIDWASPAVANGVVYIGSEDGNLYALNAGTGAKLWSYQTGNGIECAPAVANGVVYVGSGYPAADTGTFYALNASTGAKLWSYYAAADVFWGSPAVANGVVYAGSYAVGPGTGTLYALNANTGALLRKTSAGGIAKSSPAVVNGTVYIGSASRISAFAPSSANSADLFLRIFPTPTTVHQGDLITYAFPVWNLGPNNAVHEVLNTQVPEGTTLDYIRISGTPGLGTCTSPPYQGTGPIVCHENSAMAPNTTWTVRVVVKVTAPAGTVITESATTTEDTPDPNLANNTATVSMTVE